MAHEYGHVIGNLYGGNWTYGHNLSLAKQEGFANQNVLRYALWRWKMNRSSDPFPTPLQYADGDVLAQGEMYPVHGQTSEHGVYLPALNLPTDNVNFGTADDGLIYDSSSNVCRWEFEEHDCGSVLATIYWELAWNKLRVGYRGWPTDVPIIPESIEGPGDASLATDELANVAFTFAERSATGASGLEEFAAAVIDRMNS